MSEVPEFPDVACEEEKPLVEPDEEVTTLQEEVEDDGPETEATS